METAYSTKRATAAQVSYFKALHAQAGLVLASSRLRRFKALTVGQASLEIDRIKGELQAAEATGYQAPTGMATAKQLAYFSKLRHRLGEPVSTLEIEDLKTLTTSEMAEHITTTMQRLQDHNDAHGVPLPAWRLERGLYNADTLREGHRAAVARQAEQRAEVQARIRQRQEQRPGRTEIYPSEYV